MNEQYKISVIQTRSDKQKTILSEMKKFLQPFKLSRISQNSDEMYIAE